MSYHDPILPTPAPQVRADGWSPARQRIFIETLAATGIVRLACEACGITPRSAYVLRNRRDGAAFRLGWDAAILIARARLADDLMARAILGHDEVVRRDPDHLEMRRHRHDNRLAMSMLSRLDRMADNPPDGSDAALARVVAQDFAAYCDLLCPAEQADTEAARDGLPRPGQEAMARDMEDATLWGGDRPDTPDAVEHAAGALSPGASAALFVATRMALADGRKGPGWRGDERCELGPVDRTELPPDQAAQRLRGVWWDEDREKLRTDYPAPPGFAGDASDDIYDIDDYERDLTPQEEDAFAAREEAEHRPYEDAAIDARDRFFGFTAPSSQAPDAPVAAAPDADRADAPLPSAAAAPI
jgi:hypothetical protein